MNHKITITIKYIKKKKRKRRKKRNTSSQPLFQSNQHRSNQNHHNDIYDIPTEAKKGSDWSCAMEK
jgi:hypothetical protein